MIDINCDLAEGGNQDADIMPHISSCNIACGGHFGNMSTVEKAVQLAKKNKVKIGAHPSYPDFENFGRQKINISSQKLKDSLREQIQLVQNFCNKSKINLHHIKAHGALYNAMENDEKLCQVFFEVLQEIDQKLIVFVSPKSKLRAYKSSLIKYWIEGFGDRTYQDDLSLTPRSENDALLTKPEDVLNQVLVQKRAYIITQNNRKINQKFDTICLHSDTPNALEIIKYISSNLKIN
ncbi:MAG: 5-oxoprolinase subunit PxpA [Psychroflexus halocasei]